MARLADAPRPVRRSGQADRPDDRRRAVAVAVMAGVAAWMGLTSAQPLVGVVAVLAIAYAAPPTGTPSTRARWRGASACRSSSRSSC